MYNSVYDVRGLTNYVESKLRGDPGCCVPWLGLVGISPLLIYQYLRRFRRTYKGRGEVEKTDNTYEGGGECTFW